MRLLGTLGVLVGLAVTLLVLRRVLRGRRAALALEQVVESGFLLLLAGMLAGPHATAVITTEVLDQLDPFFVLGMASLGFVGGLRFDRGFFAQGRRALFVAASAQALLTMAVVGIPLVFAITMLWHEALATKLAAGFCLGIAAAASSSFALRSAARRRPESEQEPLLRLASVASLDDFVVLTFLAVVFAALHAPMAGGIRIGPLGWLGVTVGLGLVCGAVAWLLDGAVKKEAERPLFLLGTILLVGGMAFTLRLTPLVPAFVAGTFLANVAPEAGRRARATLERYEHPLLLAVLFLGGAAWVPFDATVSWLIPVWLVLRVLGKIGGGVLAAKIAPPLPPRPGYGLLPSGAFGVAVAISFARAYEGNLVAPIVTTVVIGSLASDAIGVFAWRDALVEGAPPAPPAHKPGGDPDKTLVDEAIDVTSPGVTS